MRIPAAILLLVLASGSAQADLSDSDTAENKAMHWFDAPNYQLTESKSSLGNLAGFQLLAGAESRRFREIADGISDKQQEVDVFNFKTNSELVYEWFPVGYISSTDWSDVDPDAMLTQMKERDAEANKLRVARGLTTFNAAGWRSKPSLNQNTHTVAWSIDGVNGSGGHITNSVALKLGRYGFEKIIWIYDSSLTGNNDDLALATNNHEFNAGSRYSDYVASTDRSAEYGIAGLVAGALGIKIAKAAGIGAILIGFKKLGFLLILPFIFLWKKFMGLFGRKRGPGR